MPTPSNRAFRPNYSNQIGIESLIAAPLIAASKANVTMINGQTRALLENCFVRNSESGTYEPILINMRLTRSSIQSSGNVGDRTPAATIDFSVPLVCLVPMNSLVVDQVSVDFDLEITSVTHKEATGIADGDPIISRKASLNGRVSNQASSKSRIDQDSTSRLKVNIHAGSLPLPRGLLTLLDLYEKAIQPTQGK